MHSLAVLSMLFEFLMHPLLENKLRPQIVADEIFKEGMIFLKCLKTLQILSVRLGFLCTLSQIGVCMQNLIYKLCSADMIPLHLSGPAFMNF